MGSCIVTGSAYQVKRTPLLKTDLSWICHFGGFPACRPIPDIIPVWEIPIGYLRGSEEDLSIMGNPLRGDILGCGGA